MSILQGMLFLFKYLNGLCERDSLPTKRTTAFLFVFYTDIAPSEHLVYTFSKNFRAKKAAERCPVNS